MAYQGMHEIHERAREASILLRGLSHHLRLTIVCLLTEGEKTVGELEKSLAIHQAIVSQQLARLRTDGVVSSRRDGRRVYYAVTHPETVSLLNALSAIFPATQSD